jgi:hypothetical protein
MRRDADNRESIPAHTLGSFCCFPQQPPGMLGKWILAHSFSYSCANQPITKVHLLADGSVEINRWCTQNLQKLAA